MIKFKSFLIITVSVFYFHFIASAQDQIKLKTGEIMRCKVLEAGGEVVKYRKWEFIDGPRYVLKRSDIATITYDKTPTENTNTNTATAIKPTAQPEPKTKVVVREKTPPPAAVSTIVAKPPVVSTAPKETTVAPQAVVSANEGRIDYITDKMKGIKNYLLVIANQDYIDNTINDLDHPIDDAKRVIEIITKRYTFNNEDVTFLQNPDRAEIIRAFDKLTKMVGANDNLLIFYAGHGLWDSQLKKGYWLPRNARQQDRSDWFSNSDLRDYIGGINAKHTLLIADACFSGSIFKTRDAFAHEAGANVALELFKLPSRQAMTSGAMKSVPDKSVFIDYLCKRLQENQETFLGAEQLFSSFKIAVINNSANGQIPQFGVIKESGDEGGDFVFIKR